MPEIKIYEATDGPLVEFYYAFGSYTNEDFMRALSKIGLKCKQDKIHKANYLRRRVTKVESEHTEDLL